MAVTLQKDGVVAEGHDIRVVPDGEGLASGPQVLDGGCLVDGEAHGVLRGGQRTEPPVWPATRQQHPAHDAVGPSGGFPN